MRERWGEYKFGKGCQNQALCSRKARKTGTTHGKNLGLQARGNSSCKKVKGRVGGEYTDKEPGNKGKKRTCVVHGGVRRCRKGRMEKGGRGGGKVVNNKEDLPAHANGVQTPRLQGAGLKGTKKKRVRNGRGGSKKAQGEGVESTRKVHREDPPGQKGGRGKEAPLRNRVRTGSVRLARREAKGGIRKRQG